MAGKPSEAMYGYSEDEELIDGALNDLISAYEAKDGQRLIHAFEAIVQLIQSKEESDADAHEAT